MAERGRTHDSGGADVPLRLLIVDDDDLDRLAVKRSLHHSGIRASTDEAATVEQTLAHVKSKAYDCILLDYYIPGIDGLKLLEDIRVAAPHAPVVIFTGRGDEEIAVELMKLGVADYLPKSSLSPERLASGIRHALEVTSAERARRRADRLLRLLSEAAQHLLTAADPEELVRGLFEKIKDALGIDAYVNYLVDASGSRLVIASAGGIPKDEAPPINFLDPTPGINATAAGHRRPVHATYIQESDEPMVRFVKPYGIRAMYCHPLLAEYRLLGTLGFASRTKDEFADDEIEFMKSVSHYVAAAFERLQHIEKLRQTARRKDEFLAVLSHELRDPLSPIRNLLEVVKRVRGDEEKLRRAHDAMERQLGQLEELVDDLLDVSRVAQGRLSLKKRVVELAAILRQAVEATQPLATEAGHTVDVSLPAAPLHLDADPVRLAQVFGNLLTNACKYTEPGGRIVVTAERSGHEAVVSVRDSGIGIPPEQLPSIFEMFSQIDPALERGRGGLGIGLTLVKRLVEMHGGTVEARSEGTGRGSEFIVRLPMVPEEVPDEPAEAGSEALSGAAKRVLVVDDNVDSASSLALLLQTMGHSTREAHDGPAAIEAAEAFRPDIILLDIGLPGLNGYEVCRRIRELPRGRDVVIVALTGWGQEEDRRKSQEAGFDQHLVKPVAFTSLLELLGDDK